MRLGLEEEWVLNNPQMSGWIPASLLVSLVKFVLPLHIGYFDSCPTQSAFYNKESVQTRLCHMLMSSFSWRENCFMIGLTTRPQSLSSLLPRQPLKSIVCSPSLNTFALINVFCEVTYKFVLTFLWGGLFGSVLQRCNTWFPKVDILFHHTNHI